MSNICWTESRLVLLMFCGMTHVPGVHTVLSKSSYWSFSQLDDGSPMWLNIEALTLFVPLASFWEKSQGLHTWQQEKNIYLWIQIMLYPYTKKTKCFFFSFSSTWHILQHTIWAASFPLGPWIRSTVGHLPARLVRVGLRHSFSANWAWWNHQQSRSMQLAVQTQKRNFTKGKKK